MDIANKYLDRFGMFGPCSGEFTIVSDLAYRNLAADKVLLAGNTVGLLGALGKTVPGEGETVDVLSDEIVQLRQANFNRINEALRGCGTVPR
jgi:hypothetical protein